MSDEWGPWIEHDGKGCPAVLGRYVEVDTFPTRMGAIGYRAEGVVTKADLAWEGWRLKLRYRIRRPKALREMIDLAESLPVVAPKRVEPAGPLEVM